MPPSNWPDEIHRVLAAQRVRIVGYVPDAGHKRLIELCHADAGIRAVPLTTEEEGIGLAAGARLGGGKTGGLPRRAGAAVLGARGVSVEAVSSASEAASTI